MFKKIINIIDNPEMKTFKETLAQIRIIDFSSYTDEMLLCLSQDLINKAKNGTSLDDVLVESFALVNEAIYRVLGLNAFDVQLLAGIALHKGNLIEMQTGEGKTIAAVFPAYLNALFGKGVHILTFNDYLACRDANWMGSIFNFLGLSVGSVHGNMRIHERQNAYACNITYLTAKEAGFDYLRDSLCYEKSKVVHRPFHYAIVDEADSIMIDEARVPLVIAAKLSKETSFSKNTLEIINKLQSEVDYDMDDSLRNIYLTDKGIQTIELSLNCGNLYDHKNLTLLTEINNALHAEVLLKRDVDYIVKDEKIELIDEFTGRIAQNKHWPDGLQSAVEIKEGLIPDSEGQIMSSITIQSFIHLYPKISGMTGTAISSADEFMEFYGLNTFIIPPNQPCIRKDYPDIIFLRKEAKLKAMIDEIKNVNQTGRPILIGTGSIDESESLAILLKENGVQCQVLNAKNDELEAQIIANAGALGAVNVSTNMAGRGTDIKLGGTKKQERDKIIALGGLYVIGTNRYESVRIDNQLRGRAGRQGDPGSTRFFISLEDELYMKYGIIKIIPAKYQQGNQNSPLNNPRIIKRISQVQRTIEGQNFDIRRTLWRYSYIIEMQRQYIFKKRDDIYANNLSQNLLEVQEPALYTTLQSKIHQNKLDELVRSITLYSIDQCWAEYLDHVAYIREGIHLVTIGGKNPLEEYLSQVSEEFNELNEKIEISIINALKNIKISEDGIDIGIKDIKGPSATWTYMINDNPFADDLGLMLANTHNIGFSVVAAFVPTLWINMLADLIYQRFFKRNKSID